MSRSFTAGDTRRDRHSIVIRSIIALLLGYTISQFLCPPGLCAAAADSPNNVTSNTNTQHGMTAITIGVKAGFSLSQHTGVEERDAEYGVASEWRQAGVAGVFVHLPITRRFGLQQEVLYVQKGSRQDISLDILDIPTVLHVTYDMDYVEIPVLLKYAWFISERTEVYSHAGWALSFKVNDRYTLEGEVDDGTEKAPLNADSDMSEVEMFDYSFVYGFGLEFSLRRIPMLVEYRFSIGLNRLMMPTYAYAPFGDEQLLIENDPVPLKNQNHFWVLGVTF